MSCRVDVPLTGNVHTEPDHERIGGGGQVEDGDDQAVDAARGPDVHVQGLAAGVDKAAADDDAHLRHARAAQEWGRLVPRRPLSWEPAIL